MDSKRAAALVALLFAAWEAYVAVAFISSGRVSWFWMSLRIAIVLGVAAGAIVTFLGRSTYWLVGAAFAALLWEARNLAFAVPMLLEGVWKYAWSDWSLFVPMFSPLLSLGLLLIAEGRGRRAIALARGWPHAEHN